MYQVIFVPTVAVPMWWPKLEAMLMKCPETWQDYETLESIYGGLTSQNSGNLVVVIEKGTTNIVFAAFFQIRNYTQTRVLDIHWGSGESIEKFSDLFLTAVDEFARKLGIARIEMSYARAGFKKVLAPHGYTAEKVVFRKQVETRSIQ